MTRRDTTLLNHDAILAAGLADWRYLPTALHASYDLPDYAAGAALVARIAQRADRMDHHPELALAYDRVDVRSTSHDAGGVTSRDVELARHVTQAAAAHGATARPDRVQYLDLAIDTPDADRVRPFWAAVLALPAGTHFGDPALVDGLGRYGLWFQGSPAREGRDRVHLDVYVPPEEAAGRIRAALDAGGRMVTERFAPSWWVLADPDDNLVCVCTMTGMD